MLATSLENIYKKVAVFIVRTVHKPRVVKPMLCMRTESTPIIHDEED